MQHSVSASRLDQCELRRPLLLGAHSCDLESSARPATASPDDGQHPPGRRDQSKDTNCDNGDQPGGVRFLAAPRRPSSASLASLVRQDKLLLMDRKLKSTLRLLEAGEAPKASVELAGPADTNDVDDGEPEQPETRAPSALSKYDNLSLTEPAQRPQPELPDKLDASSEAEPPPSSLGEPVLSFSELKSDDTAPSCATGDAGQPDSSLVRSATTSSELDDEAANLNTLSLASNVLAGYSEEDCSLINKLQAG